MRHSLFISCNNIQLRPLEEADIEYLRNWRNNPENTEFLCPIPYITSEMQKAWFDGYLNNEDEITFGIVETVCLNRLIGSLSLYHFQDGQAEFGKILIGDPDAHGKKAGLNATMAALKIGFEQLGLNRIILNVYEENLPALHIYKKAGFRIVHSAESPDGKRELRMEATPKIFDV